MISLLFGVFLGFIFAHIFVRVKEHLKPLSIERMNNFQLKDYVKKKGWYQLRPAEEGFWIYENPGYPLRMLLIPKDQTDVGYEDAMSDVRRRLTEIEGKENGTQPLSLNPYQNQKSLWKRKTKSRYRKYY